MTYRVYGCIDGQDLACVQTLLSDRVQHYGLGCRDLRESDIDEIESRFQSKHQTFCFELTDSPKSYTAQGLLDPSNWDPSHTVPVPVSLRADERLDALIGLFESLFESSFLEGIAVVMTDHDIEKIKHVSAREFREVCLSDFVDVYWPPNVLYIISCNRSGG